MNRTSIHGIRSTIRNSRFASAARPFRAFAVQHSQHYSHRHSQHRGSIRSSIRSKSSSVRSKIRSSIRRAFIIRSSICNIRRAFAPAAFAAATAAALAAAVAAAIAAALSAASAVAAAAAFAETAAAFAETFKRCVNNGSRFATTARGFQAFTVQRSQQQHSRHQRSQQHPQYSQQNSQTDKKKYQTAYMSTNMPANMTILYLKRYGKRHRTQKRHANDALSRQPLCQAHHWQAFARIEHTDAEACQSCAKPATVVSSASLAGLRRNVRYRAKACQ